MKMFAMQAALVAALAGTGAAAFAAESSAMSSGAMPAATLATMVCRPAASGEKATAMTSANAPLVCKPLDMPAMMAMKAKIEAMPGGEPVWLQMLQEFHIDSR